MWDSNQSFNSIKSVKGDTGNIKKCACGEGKEDAWL